MKKRKNRISRPLDIIFSAPSHIFVLRTLRNVKEGLSGREVARRAGINHQTCADALTRLEGIGVVIRLGSGKNQLFRINRKNILVKRVILPMFDAEHNQFILLQEDLARVLKGHCLSGLLFGSVARREDTPESDFDIALIVEKKQQKLHEILRSLVQHGTEKWGIRVSPIIITRTDFIKKSDKKDPLVTDILKDGIVIYGQSPHGLLK